MAIAEEKISALIRLVSEKVLAWGLPFFYFLVSIAFYLRTYDSAQIKITLVQILGTIFIGVWMIKLLEEDFLEFVNKNLIIILPLVAFLLSGVFSFSHSYFFYASWNELVKRIIYIFIALIVIKEFDSDQKFSILFKVLFWATFVATFYGIIQYLDAKYFAGLEKGLDPFVWRMAFGTRIFSTFGNPNFFGDFLVVMSPIILAMFFRRRQPIYLFLWFMTAFCVVQTGSKGAWLGFAVGLVAFAFLLVIFFLRTKKKWLKYVIIGAMIVSMAIAYFGIKENLRERTDSGSFRIFTWISTWEMINTNPWIGTGIGSYYVTYPAFRRPQIFFIEAKHNTESDHPEDEYLEVWYDEGYIGFGIFLWLLGTFLFISFKNLRAFSEQDPLKKYLDIRAYYQLGILSSLIAQLSHNMVCVSLRFVSSGIFLWLLIGIIGSLCIHNPLSAKTPPPSPNPKTLLPLSTRRVVQIIIIIAVAFFVKIFYGYFDADMKHNLGIFYSKQGQWDKALASYSTVVKENPSFIMAHYFMGNVYNDRWAAEDGNNAIKKYEDVWKLAPNYVQSRHQAGLIYIKWAEDEKRRVEEARVKGDTVAMQEHQNKLKELYNKALYELNRYKEIDPIFPVNYYRIAYIYLQLGDLKKAEEAYLEHINYPEKLKAPPHNAWVENWSKRRLADYAETYMYLGNLMFGTGNAPKAKEYYKKGLELVPGHLNITKNLAILYANSGDMASARALWEELRKANPDDPDVKKVFGLK